METRRPAGSIPRRGFFRKAAGGAVALAGLPAILPGTRSALGASAADRIVLGAIGVGGRGSGLLGMALGRDDVSVAAVSDVDRNHLDAAVRATGGSAEGFGDYRKILDRKDVDAVVIATPDHWHAVASIDAMRAGKDVYVEKPLTTFLAEGRAVVKAARKHGRVVQVGIHHRSEEYIRAIVRIVRGGRIGKVKLVRCWVFGNPFEPRTPPEDPPPELDWDRWLGPAPWRPYHPKRVHFNFRWCRDTAGGYMTDWGVHMLNVVTFAMDVDLKGPSTVEAKGTFAEGNLYDFPISMEARFEFEDPDFTLTWTQPGDGGDVLPGEKYGMTFYGEDGELRTSFGAHKFYRDGEEAPLPREGREVEVPASPGHFQNWLECTRSRATPIADVEIGHRTTSACILGNIALWTGRKLRWDWRAEKFVGDLEANALLSRENREPYKPRGA